MSDSALRHRILSERLTVWMVTALVFLSGGLALFDVYLLLTGVR